MNISRLHTHGTQLGVTGQAQRHLRLAKTAPVETAPPVATTPPTDEAAPAEAAKKTSHPRLAAYAEKIDKRLTAALDAKDITPRQKAALAEAKDHFHGMINRLDAAYSSPNSSVAKKQTMQEGLDMLLDHVAGTVNHIQSGGDTTVDVKG